MNDKKNLNLKKKKFKTNFEFLISKFYKFYVDRKKKNFRVIKIRKYF